MSTAKINIKNIDYFKYRKLVIDGNRDDYSVCSREVKSLCDAVQTLSFRDDEFDDASDRTRFDEVSTCYRQILASKRIDPVDMRLKSGWWGDSSRTGSGYSAGKIKSTMLLEVLSAKTRDWAARHQDTSSLTGSDTGLESHGLFVFKHREHQCYQLVGRADNVFVRCSELLKAAFDGTVNDAISALLVISLASDWDFYYVPVQLTAESERLERILENDLILKHDSIWPHGLNFSLHMDSLIEAMEFRRSCLRHRWPPEYDTAPRERLELDLDLVRCQLAGTSGDGESSAESTSPNHGSSANMKTAVVNSDSRDKLLTRSQRAVTSPAVSSTQHLHLVSMTTSDVAGSQTRSSAHAASGVSSKSSSKLKHSNQKPTTTTSTTATTTTTTTNDAAAAAAAAVIARSTATTTTSNGHLHSDVATTLTTSPASDDCDVVKRTPATLLRSSTYTSLVIADDHSQNSLPSTSTF